MSKGVDYSSGHPGGAALKAAGVTFAARYVSHTADKNITLSEAADLAAHGVSVVVVWETTANRAAAGRSAGIADAHDAIEQATAAGMPPGRPLYFAVDWDADPAVVVPYFQGVASVLGSARVGGYGGYKVIRYLLDHGLITFAWQTAAWSAGQWDSRAHIRQPATGVHINGVACDNDTAHAADFGQWMPAKSPTPEDDVPLTPADISLLLDTRMDDPTDTGKATVTVRGALWAAYGEADKAANATAKLVTQITALTATVQTLSGLVGSGVDTAAVVAAVEQAIATAVVHVDVDVTGPTAP